MNLALRGSGTNGTPGNEVSDVLGRNGVEEFGACGDTHLRELEEKPPGDPKTTIDVKGAVKMRIVDETLPTHGGARLLKVDPHHDLEVVGILLDEGLKLFSILERSLGMMDGAGPDDDEQAIILAVQNVGGLFASLRNEFGRRLRNREVVVENCGRYQRVDALDAQVVGGRGAHARESPESRVGNPDFSKRKERNLKGRLIIDAICRIGLVVECRFEGREGFIGRGIGVAAIAFEDLPSMQIDVVTSLVLRAAKIEMNLHLVTFGDVVEKADLVFDALEFDFLRVLLVGGLENELALREPAGKTLEVEDGVNFAFDFESRHGWEG
jgi:hypothetical protein